MPQQSWSSKRERQYAHIKERARTGEAKTSSRSSRQDISSGRRASSR